MLPAPLGQISTFLQSLMTETQVTEDKYVRKPQLTKNKCCVVIPASKRDTCKFPPFLSSRRSSASECGLTRVMAVDGGLWGTQQHTRLVLVMSGVG